MKTIIYSAHKFDQPYLEMATKNKHDFIFTEEFLSKETVNLAQGCQAASLFISDNATDKILESLYKVGVRYITLRSAGCDHIDLKKCHKLGIKVANIPNYSPFAIAEHAITLMLCLNRKIKLSQDLIKKGDFRLDQLIGFDMKDKTIGIMGVGRIGSAVARIAYHGFGCKILGFDIKENKALKEDIDIRYVSIDELCQNSDIISLHFPITNLTKHILHKDKFALMKDEVLIVNTSRGGVIKTEDLLDALNNNKIKAAGLDVYEFEQELFFKHHKKHVSDPLFNALEAKPNVIMTSHQSFLTDEALQNIAKTTVYNLDCWEKGEVSEYEF